MADEILKTSANMKKISDAASKTTDSLKKQVGTIKEITSEQRKILKEAHQRIKSQKEEFGIQEKIKLILAAILKNGIDLTSAFEKSTAPLQTQLEILTRINEKVTKIKSEVLETKYRDDAMMAPVTGAIELEKIKADSAKFLVVIKGMLDKGRELTEQEVNEILSFFSAQVKNVMFKLAVERKTEESIRNLLGMPTINEVNEQIGKFKAETDSALVGMKASFEKSKENFANKTGLEFRVDNIQEVATAKRLFEELGLGIGRSKNQLTILGAELRNWTESSTRSKTEILEDIKAERDLLAELTGQSKSQNDLATKRIDLEAKIVMAGKELYALTGNESDLRNNISDRRKLDTLQAEKELKSINLKLKTEQEIATYIEKERASSISRIDAMKTKYSELILSLKQIQGGQKLVDEESVKRVNKEFESTLKNVEGIERNLAIQRIALKGLAADGKKDTLNYRNKLALVEFLKDKLIQENAILANQSKHQNELIISMTKVAQSRNRMIELGIKFNDIENTSLSQQEEFVNKSKLRISTREKLLEIQKKVRDLEFSRKSGITEDQVKLAIQKKYEQSLQKNQDLSIKIAVATKNTKNLTAEQLVQYKKIISIEKENLALQQKYDILMGRRSSVLSTLHAKHRSIMTIMGQRIRFIATAGLAYKLQNTFISMFKDSLKKVLQLEKEIAEIGTLQTENLETVNLLLQKYKQTILSLSQEYGEETSKLTKALYDIRSATIDTYKALEVLEVVVRAGKASITDAKTAVVPIIAILNAYKMEASEAEHVSDMLFATIQRGVTTMAELAPNIGKAIAAAAMVGVDAPQVLAMVSSTTRMGVSTRETITAINRLMLNFSKQTEAATGIAAKYGFTLDDLREKKDGLVNLFYRMKDATDQEKIALVGSVRAFKAMAAGVLDVQGQMFDLEYITNAGGKTEEAMEKIRQTVSYKYEQIIQKINAALVNFGDKLIPVFDNILDQFDKLEAAGIADVIENITIWVSRMLGAFAGYEVINLATQAIVAFGKAVEIISGVKATSKVVSLLGVWGKIASIVVSIAGMFWAGSKVKNIFNELEEKRVLKEKKIRAEQQQLLYMQEIESMKLRNKAISDQIDEYKDLNAKSKGTEAENRRLDDLFKDITESARDAGISIGGYGTNLETVEGIAKDLSNQLEELTKIQISKQILSIEQELININVETVDDFKSRIDYSFNEKALTYRDSLYEFYNSIKRYEEVGPGESGIIDFTKYKQTFTDFLNSNKDLISYDINELNKVIENYLNDANNNYEEFSNFFDKLSNIEDKTATVEDIFRRDYLGAVIDKSKNQNEFYGNLIELENEIRESVSTTIISGIEEIDAKVKVWEKSGMLSQETIKKLRGDLLEKQANEVDKQTALADYILKQTENFTKKMSKEEQKSFLQELYDSYGKQDKLNLTEAEKAAKKRIRDLSDLLDKYRDDSISQIVEKTTKIGEDVSKQLMKIATDESIKLVVDEIALDPSIDVNDLMGKVSITNADTKSVDQLNMEKELIYQILLAYQSKANVLIWNNELEQLNINYNLEKQKYLNGMTDSEDTLNYLIEERLNKMEAIALANSETFDRAVERKKLEDDLSNTIIKRQTENHRQNIILEKDEDKIRSTVGLIVREQMKLNELTIEEADALYVKLMLQSKILLNMKELEALTKQINLDEKEKKQNKFIETTAKFNSDDGSKEILATSSQDLMDYIKYYKEHYDEMSEADRLFYNKTVSMARFALIKKSTFAMIGVKEYQHAAEIKTEIEQKVNEVIIQGIQFVQQAELNRIEKVKQSRLDAADEEAKSLKASVASQLLTSAHAARVNSAIDKQTADKKEAIEEKYAKKAAKARKEQAKFQLSIDFAKGVFGIWASALSKDPIFGSVTAGIVTALLTGIYGVQLNMIDKAKYASGGYTGHGSGASDSTGQKPAGVVHEKEFVLNRHATRGNVGLLYSMQDELSRGKSFADFAIDYLSGNISKMYFPNVSGLYASGGYAGSSISQSNGDANTGRQISILSQIMSQQNELIFEMNSRLNNIEHYNRETSDNTNKLRRKGNGI